MFPNIWGIHKIKNKIFTTPLSMIPTQNHPPFLTFYHISLYIQLCPPPIIKGDLYSQYC